MMPLHRKSIVSLYKTFLFWVFFLRTELLYMLLRAAVTVKPKSLCSLQLEELEVN